MLTKFLLIHNFPASCFFSQYGIVTSYKIEKTKVVVFYIRKNMTYTITSIPLSVIQIPPTLFKLHIKSYFALLKQLETVPLLELTPPKNTSILEEDISKNIITSLPYNPLFNFPSQGELINPQSSRLYNLPTGEIVYIHSVTSTNYTIKAVDGYETRIPKTDIQITAGTSKEKIIEKWKTNLNKLQEEYEEFLKNFEQ